MADNVARGAGPIITRQRKWRRRRASFLPRSDAFQGEKNSSWFYAGSMNISDNHEFYNAGTEKRKKLDWVFLPEVVFKLISYSPY